MKRYQRYPLFLLLLLSSACAPRLDNPDFFGHVSYLADDRLEGRGVGTRQIEQAAEYIADQFENVGLTPGGEGGTYFQSFNVALGQTLTGKSSLSIDGVVENAKLSRDFVPLPFSASESFEGLLAFAGYGITNKDADYDDYADFDAKGKVLLILRYEPHDDDTKAEFGGESPSRHATFESKARLAHKNGAKALLIVNPPAHHGDEDKLYPFEATDHAQSFSIPMLNITRELAQKLLNAGGGHDLAALQQSLDRDRKPKSIDMNGLIVKGDPGLERKHAATRNVIGILRGNGPHADEYVVVGAHYDHLGRTIPRGPRSTSQPSTMQPQIHNGADDNASGVAGIIEIARLLAADNPRDRSIVFIAFSAEEIGLLGSKHFVTHPTVPLEQIVAMLNLDMVGRLRENRLQIFGTKTADTFTQLAESEAQRSGFDLKTSGGGFGPSDHTSFYTKKIPVMHFFTGIHNDYHRPGDDTDKINTAGAIRVIDMIYRIASHLANAPERPAYVAVAESQPSRTGLKVRLGLMPSYAEDDQAGMLIDGVSPGSPAEKAGLRDGDRILMIGNHTINNVYDLMDAMAQYEPGNEAAITIMRAGQKISLPAKFESP